MAARAANQPMTEPLGRLQFLCTDLAILQFVWDAQRHPERFCGVFPTPACLHLVMFCGLESWVDRWSDSTSLGVSLDLMTVLNIKDENSKFLIEDPTARTRKMLDSLTKWVFGVGIRMVEVVKERFPSLDMATLSHEQLFEKVASVARHHNTIGGTGLCRLHAECEAAYELLSILDCWEAAHAGENSRVTTALYETASLVWSAPNDKTGASLKLRHTKKAGEHPRPHTS